MKTKITDFFSKPSLYMGHLLRKHIVFFLNLYKYIKNRFINLNHLNLKINISKNLLKMTVFFHYY